MGFIKADRNQQNLIGYCINDFAKADEKSHFIEKTVNRLNLNKLLTRYSRQGGEAFAPDMMLALWFYAYSEGITSTRKLEELCRYDTRYIYLSCNLQPDHTTLSRFRQYHLDLLVDYFVQIVMLCEEDGFLDLKHISIDGTKIKASCSARQSLKNDQLAHKIETVRRDISRYMQRCNWAEQYENEEIDLETLRLEKNRLQELEKKLVKRQRQLKERQRTLKPEHRKNHQINIVEPEARFMPHSDGPSYNAEAAVDNETHFILANDVTDEPNDQNQFAPMHKKTEQALPDDPHRKYTADSGFHSLNQLEYIEEKKIDAVIADPTPKNRSNSAKPTSVESILKEKRKVKRSDFTYYATKDYYECPAGDQLTLVSSYKDGKKRKKIYRASRCQTCPLVHLCVSSKKRIKQIHRDHRESLAEKMSRKLKSDEANIRMKDRATSVEPVFGNIKHNLGFRRFNLKGIKKVKGEFNLMCIAHNLNILFNVMQKRRFAAIMYALQFKLYQHIAISKNKMAYAIIK